VGPFAKHKMKNVNVKVVNESLMCPVVTGMGDGDSVRRYVALLYPKLVALTKSIIHANLSAHRPLIHVLKVAPNHEHGTGLLSWV
jgi:hypothetical protein